MKLTFLGTAAAEGVPAVFCNCDTCKRAKERGGKEIRTRSQILIDDDMLFDFPMDTYMHMLRYKLDLSKIRHVLITHAHMDHCYPQEFCMRGDPFARGLSTEKVEVFCNETVKAMFLNDTAREIRPEIAKNIEVSVLHPYDRIQRDGTLITALPAAHTKGEDCLVYCVGRGGKNVAFLNDTGILDEDVYKRLADLGVKLDGATFDCTYGAKRHGAGRHMGLYDIVDQSEIMNKVGLLKDGAVLVATHFSHNTDLDFDGMVKAAAPYGIVVAYDGLELNV
ncbi:MAG: hypothetical protein K2M48_01635 [Clostridiales bacterium]|nr:hypothetical protein [Clostridiales bacterium]